MEDIVPERENKFYSVDETKCYRELNLPFEFKEPAHPRDKFKIERVVETIVPMSAVDEELKQWLNSLNLVSDGLRFFVGAPNTNYRVHVDTPYPKENMNVFLNFPFDDEGTVMRWFKLKPSKQVHWSYYTIEGKTSKVINARQEDCDVVCTMVAPGSQPVLVNAGYLHDLRNSTKHRHCWSFPLLKLDGSRLQWDEAEKIFGPYFKSET